MSDDNVIRCMVQVVKVQTLSAGGWRAHIDGNDYDAMTKLIKAQAPGIMLELVGVAVLQEETGDNGTVSKRPVGKSEWSPPKE